MSAQVPHLHDPERIGTTISERDDENGVIEELDKDKTGDAITDAKQVAVLPYHECAPEVRAVVPETDDPNTPCESVRAYVLGTLCAVIGTALNTWFGARQPGIYINPLVAQCLVHPVGLAWAKWIPHRDFHIFNLQFTLNPGPWSIKEHCLTVLMATVSLPTATALDIIIVTKLPIFFNQPELGGKLGYQFLVVLSTQFIGFGMAGLARNFLVYPHKMIWPLNLAKISLFNALHKRSVDENGVVVIDQTVEEPPVNGWKISGYRFCLWAVVGSFCWLFVTDFLCPFLTFFNWPTWISPTNTKLAVIMGSITGLGLNPIPTVDWTFMTSAGLQPLITPFFATLQIFIGASISFLVICGIYFSNSLFTAYLPANSNSPFDRFGKRYNISRVLDTGNRLDETKYKAYSPLYFSAGYNMVLTAHLAQYSAAIVYALTDHWDNLSVGFGISYRNAKRLWQRRRTGQALDTDEAQHFDVHYALRKSYDEVPQSWFLVTAAVSLVFGIAACEGYHNTMPVWGIILAFLIASIMFIPSGIIMAITNMQITITTLSEILGGVVIPGRPQANMMFKLYGWVGLSHAQLYVQDQKLAHYLHVPPKASFRAQMWGCLVGSFVSLGILNWQMNAVHDLCVPGQKDFMTCPYYTTFFSSALMFGAVGPSRMYGPHGLYRYLLFGLLVGAVVTVIFSLAKRRWPKADWMHSITIPIIFTGASFYAPWNLAYVYSGLPYAWLFMNHIRRRFRPWWNKYCYLLAIGLTVGAAISGIIQFFCVTYPGGKLTWWGTTFYRSGCDGKGCHLEPLPTAGYFGPGPGHFS